MTNLDRAMVAILRASHSPADATIRLEEYVPTQADEYPIGYTVMASLYRTAEGWWDWDIVSYDHPNPGMAPGDPNGELYDYGSGPTFAAAVRRMADSWANRWGDEPTIHA